MDISRGANECGHISRCNSVYFFVHALIISVAVVAVVIIIAVFRNSQYLDKIKQLGRRKLSIKMACLWPKFQIISLIAMRRSCENRNIFMVWQRRRQ